MSAGDVAASSRRLAIMQPYFFPYVGYFQLIHHADLFLLYGNVSFRKKSWITRNRLRQPGRSDPVVVHCPIRSASSEAPINTLYLDEQSGWRRQLLRRLAHDYRRRPHFEATYALLESLLATPEERLAHFHAHCLRGMASHIGLRTPILFEDAAHAELEAALAEHPADARPDRKTQRVIQLCRALEADAYLNPEGGARLYGDDDFRQAGLALSFLQSRVPAYEQGEPDRIANLSMIDVLMNLGAENTYRHMTSCRIVTAAQDMTA